MHPRKRRTALLLRSHVALSLFSLAACGEKASSPAAVDAGIDAARIDASMTLPDASSSDAGRDATSPSDGGVAVPDGGVLASSEAQFSGVQGESGWHYGYIAPATSPEFVPMTNFRVDPTYGAIWSVDPALYWTQLRAVDAHGNGTTTTGVGHVAVEHWAVRRWISPYDANVDLEVRFAKFNDDASGNGVVGRIVVDGASIWSHTLAPADTTGVSVVLPIDADVGTTIDFVLEPYLSNDLADLTTFTATIRVR